MKNTSYGALFILVFILGCSGPLQVERNFAIQAAPMRVENEVFSQRAFLKENEHSSFLVARGFQNYHDVGPTSIGFRMSASPYADTGFRILYAEMIGVQDKKVYPLVTQPSKWHRSIDNQHFLYNHTEKEKGNIGFPAKILKESTGQIYYAVDWIGFGVELDEIEAQDYDFFTKLEYCIGSNCTIHTLEGSMLYTRGDHWLKRLFDIVMSV